MREERIGEGILDWCTSVLRIELATQVGHHFVGIEGSEVAPGNGRAFDQGGVQMPAQAVLHFIEHAPVMKAPAPQQRSNTMATLFRNDSPGALTLDEARAREKERMVQARRGWLGMGRPAMAAGATTLDQAALPAMPGGMKVVWTASLRACQRLILRKQREP